MRLSDVLQDRLDTANKSRSHVMGMAIQKQKRIEELEESNKELTLQLLAVHGQASDVLDRAVVAEARLAKAVELLKEARQDLEEYVTHEWQEEYVTHAWPRDEHPVYERKWEQDMELCRRIDAMLAELEGMK
jgi:aspartyl/asparaginyl-tRNA synthetase